MRRASKCRVRNSKTLSALVVLQLSVLCLSMGCGSDSDSEEEGDATAECSAAGLGGTDVTAAGSRAQVVNFDSTTVSLSFSDAQADDKYLLIPYILGDLSTVEGFGTETFTITMSTAAKGGKFTKLSLPGRREMTSAEFDHAKRMLAQRFSRGGQRGPSFWDLAREVDRYRERELPPLFPTKSRTGFAARYRELAAKRARSPAKNQPPLAKSGKTLMQESLCPVDGDGEAIIPDETLEDTTSTLINGGAVIDETDYCLIQIDTLQTTTVEKVKESMTAIMARYRDVIYKDEFPTADGFKFKPTIITIDIGEGGNEDWPQDILNLSGVYLASISEETDFPMIYIASDMKKVVTRDTDKEIEQVWHGTLAHELQHAISDYYKQRKVEGAPETISIDEGIAHFMEDVFGYGPDIFADRGLPFLGSFASGLPILQGSGSPFQQAGRGAAHAFIYYLASQMGGVQFQEGTVCGGDGLKFVVDTVKETELSGPANLNSHFQGQWVETVGHFLGALALDGTSLNQVSSKHQVQPVVDGVKDLNGNSDKVFGMRFNGFGGVADHMDEYTGDGATTFDEYQDGVEIRHYEFAPVLYTVSGAADTVTVTVPDKTGAGVTVVRLSDGGAVEVAR